MSKKKGQKSGVVFIRSNVEKRQNFWDLALKKINWLLIFSSSGLPCPSDSSVPYFHFESAKKPEKCQIFNVPKILASLFRRFSKPLVITKQKHRLEMEEN